MKKLLAVMAVTVAFAAVANAAEEKGTEFKFGGELRTRYALTMNPFLTDSNQPTENNFNQRNQFHVNAVTSDKMQAYFNFLHYSRWGAGSAVPVNSASNGGTTVTTTNALQVHEAWMWWKWSDMLSMRAGRQSMNYGDGFIISNNEGQIVPYNAEALMFRAGWDFLDLDFGGGKFADFGVTSARGSDAEVLFYGLYAAFKNLPEVIKTVDLALLQVNGDQGLPGSNFIPGAAAGGSWNVLTVAPHIKGDVSMIDYRVDGAFQSGKQKATTVGTADTTFSGYMLDAEVGVNFPEVMKARFNVGYHMDTGDDSTTVDKNEGYQPLFYDRSKTGSSNIFGWGNLTDLYLGFSLKPTEDLTVGVDAHMLSRTTDKSGARLLGSGDTSVVSDYTLTGLSTGTDKAMATDVGVYAESRYGKAFSVRADLSFLSVGSYYKPAGASVGSGTQLELTGKYNF